ncbi:uncharacterized protein K02A2.6-like [Macrosteles quadrilineatus]|uniref:uncharacterized protein K02A2.6-like n=1 Tax=Macrosteles quadrilineatus TaxID=74068 RepID=UPI0023E235EB|nr:uncharacterized protein K02A2.6-like [Macrosteles quadrilineatus]
MRKTRRIGEEDRLAVLEILQCAQKEGEAVSEFAVQLKKLASTCDFKEFLDDALRDRFLCGLRSNEIQSRLLSEGDTLTFDKALQLALVLEDASRSARVTNNDTTLDLPMVIIRSETPNQPVLLGRNWLNRIKLDWGKLVKDNNLDGRQVKDKDMVGVVNAAARIQRWALTLAAYDYELVYRKGSDMCNADAMSRLPCNVDCNPDEVVAFFSSIDEMPITFKEISLATRHDPVLSKVLDYTLNGWPSYNNSPQLKPYFSRSTELSVEQDCLLWGRRVVIPAPHRKEVLALLHKEHPGESRMKNLARSYVWWPNMDNDLEEMVKNCFICQSTRNSLQLAPLQQWSWPKHCWQRIHIDFASFHNKEFLIIIDGFSKWMEVFYMTSITSAKTIEKLRTCFSAYGLPSTLVSDGGPQLNSKEFDDFLKANAILHVVTPPYHPASNGLAERAVQTTKKSFIRQLLHDEKSGEPRALQHRIDSFLFAYRNTPHSTTGSTPAELFLRFVPRNHLSLLKPHLARSVDEKQLKMEEAANKRRGKFRSFVVGEEVYVKSVRQESLNWMPGQVVKVVSQVTYLVKVQGRTRFVHADHLRPKFGTNVEEETLMTLPTPVSPGRPKTSPGINKTVEEMKDGCEMDQPIIQDEVHEPDPVKTVKTPSPGGPLRRSQRERKPPRKLDL